MPRQSVTPSFVPKRPGVARWATVVAGALGVGLGEGIFLIYAFGVLAPAIARDLGWSRTVLNNAVTCALLGTGVGAIALGRLIAMRGVRAPSIVMVLLFGATIAAIAALPASPWLLLLDFALLGLCGAAATAMPYAIAIAGLFDRRRGLALGIVIAGGGVGSTIAPLLSRMVLARLGWRETMVALAVLFGLVPVIGLARFVPADAGVARDSMQPGFWRTQLRDRCFWTIVAAVAGNSIAAIGMMTSLVPILTDRGVEARTSAMVLSVAGAASWFGRLASGWLLDRLFAPWIGAGIFSLAAIGVALLVLGPVAGASIFLGGSLVGLCLGSEADLLAYLVSRYFPLPAYSRIVGVGWVAWAWGGGVGNWLAGRSFLMTRSYVAAASLFLIMLLGAAAVLLLLPVYRFPPASEPARA